MPRKIIHLDLDAFFCAVEELRDPSLRGKPFAVGGRPDERGVVSSCSYAARQYGVHSAMPMGQALKLCHQLIIVSSNHHLYSQYSDRVMQRLHDLTPLVEQISIDEAFLDVSDLPEPAETIGRQLQKRIQTELQLPCSLGIATNKLVAKMATDVGKAANRGPNPPNALTVVPPGQEAAFIAPLPVIALWGVGPKTAAELAKIGLHTIGDICLWPEQDLVERFGKLGAELAMRAHGIDDRPIVTEHEVKSISQETTFARDISDPEQLRATLRDHCNSVGRRLRKAHLLGSTIKIKLRWSDFTTLTRQLTLPQPSDQDAEILAAAEQLFQKNWQPGKRVRLLGVGVSGLTETAQQLSLWENAADRGRRLQSVVDELQDRFGNRVIQRGYRPKKNAKSK